MIHIPQGLRGLWKRKRSPSLLRPCQDCSGRPRQSIRVERGQSASPPHLCPVGQEVGRRAATAPKATPPLNIEKERTRDAAREMARWVQVTLSLGICHPCEYLTSTVDTGKWECNLSSCLSTVCFPYGNLKHKACIRNISCCSG